MLCLEYAETRLLKPIANVTRWQLVECRLLLIPKP